METITPTLKSFKVAELPDDNKQYAEPRKEIMDNRVRELAVERANSTIEQKVNEIIHSEEFSRVRITTIAFDKAKRMVAEFQALTDSANTETYELGMLLLSAKRDYMITDVYLPNSQEVRQGHCNIDGLSQINAGRYARQKGIDIRSMAHSHGRLGVFLSTEDTTTLATLISSFEGVLVREIECNGQKQNVVISPTFVLNAAGEEYGAIQFSYLILEATPLDEPLKIRQKVKLVQKVPIEKIGEGDALSFFGNASIRRQLLAGYNIRGGVVLCNGSSQARLSDIVNSRAVAARCEDDMLEARAKYDEMEQRYTKQVQATQDARMQAIQERAGLYRRSMEQFYSPMLRSRSEAAKAVGKIAKILSGEYRGTVESVKQGLPEGKGETRIWVWKDRIAAARVIYKAHSSEIAQHRQLFMPIWEVLRSNNYAHENYSDDIRKLKNYLVR